MGYVRKDLKGAHPHRTRSAGYQKCVEVGALFDFIQCRLESIREGGNQAVGGRERRANNNTEPKTITSHCIASLDLHPSAIH